MEAEHKWRYRVNVGRSVKGIVTPDYTVEGTDVTEEEFLEKLAWLEAEVLRRYPLQVE